MRVLSYPLLRLCVSCLALLAGAGCAVCACSAPAGALILAPATLDGPSGAIGEFGGVAVSADGSGGLVYTKQVGGTQHVFAARYAAGRWQAPIQVDWDTPYGASQPRVAAADEGRLVVVWVAQIATVGERVQDALYASTLDPGASSFGPPFVVDPNVGEGVGVSPSLALAANGQGLVAYRAVTDNFKNSLVRTTLVQLRPGDVLADVRIARYEGELWSAPVRINRDPRLSMRAPSEANGPQVALGRGDQAVVAWQEPESNGVARIWARRVFGTTLGLALQASPVTYAGQAVTADADAFALGVSEFGAAKVVSRVQGTPGTPLPVARLFANTLPVSTAFAGAQFTGAAPLGGMAAVAGVGTPSVAIDDQGDFRLAFTAAGAANVLQGGEQGEVRSEVALGPAVAATGSGAVTALNPEGGGATAWPGSDPQGRLGVGVREDFPNGGAQAALVSGVQEGLVSELAAGGSESGESLIGFREGNLGAYEIVGVGVTAPPPAFLISVPRGWVKPAQATCSWSSDEDATGGVTYSLLIDGRVVLRGLRGLSALPDRRLLGSGVRHIQVLATDASGQQTLSSESILQVDGEAPVARVRRGRGRSVIVTVRDAQSGALARATSIAFGDGSRVRGRLTVRHAYAHPGRYTIVVRMRDRVGNAGVAHLRVSVR